MFKKLTLACCVLSICLAAQSCQTTNQPNKSYESSSPSLLLSATEFQKSYQAQPQAHLVDVRTPEEFAAGSLPKAVNIDYYADDFAQQLAQLDKSQPLFIFCQKGGRSADAHKIALKAGFKQVVELDGGYLAWKAQR